MQPSCAHAAGKRCMLIPRRDSLTESRLTCRVTPFSGGGTTGRRTVHTPPRAPHRPRVPRLRSGSRHPANHATSAISHRQPFKFSAWSFEIAVPSACDPPPRTNRLCRSGARHDRTLWWAGRIPHGVSTMNDRQTRAIASGDDALACARNLPNRPPTVQVAMRDLETILNLARAAIIQQHSAGVSVSGPRRATANALATLRKKHLAPIVSHGTTLLKGYPGIEESLKMPPLKASVDEQIKAAERIREAVAPHRAIFIKQKKHSSTFIKELDA